MRYSIFKTSLLALTTIITSSIAYGASSEGRWCGVGGAQRSSFRGQDGQYSRVPNTLTAVCDGYATSGSLDDRSKVTQLGIELYPAKGSPSQKPETITLSIKDLRASDVADYISGKQQPFKDKVAAALASRNPPILNRSSFNLVSMEVERSAILYDDQASQKKMLPLPEVGIEKPSEVIKSLHVEGQPFAPEMACISQMQKLPSSGINTAVNNSKKSTPAAVITGKTQDDKNIDLVVVPDGILTNKYPKNLRGVESEHFVEIPAIDKSKKPVAYYHSLSDSSASNTHFEDQPYQSYRPKKVKLDASKLETDKTGKAHQLLNSAILDYTKEYREQFDRDPRLKSRTNLTLLRNALNSCMEVPGLMEANNGELSYFEDYIYRDQREVFPKRTVVPASKREKTQDGNGIN